jgi:NAD(P)H-dependent flavin oxidoreductase YrpB (nitropropane dioxygenase family)
MGAGRTGLAWWQARLGFPILCAPMGPDVSGPELVAAVSNAGGLGIMQAQLQPRGLRHSSRRRFPPRKH